MSELYTIEEAIWKLWAILSVHRVSFNSCIPEVDVSILESQSKYGAALRLFPGLISLSDMEREGIEYEGVMFRV